MYWHSNDFVVKTSIYPFALAFLARRSKRPTGWI